MEFSQEVLASIIKVAGDWSLGMASTPDNGPPQPSHMSGELQDYFEHSFNYLTGIIGEYVSGPS